MINFPLILKTTCRVYFFWGGTSLVFFSIREKGKSLGKSPATLDRFIKVLPLPATPAASPSFWAPGSKCGVWQLGINVFGTITMICEENCSI